MGYEGGLDHHGVIGGDDGVAIGTAPSLWEGGSTLPCRDPQHNWLARWTLYRTLLTSVVSEGFIQTMYKVVRWSLWLLYQTICPL